MLKHSLECSLNSFNIHHKNTSCHLKIEILSEEEYKEVLKRKYEKDKQDLADQLANRVMEADKLNKTQKESKTQSALDLYKNDMEELENEYMMNLDNAANDVDERIVITGDFTKYPAGELQALLRDFHKIKSEYGNINKRNHKKDAIHMAKHMTHLLRLYKMGTLLNTSMEIKTHWDGKDREMLMEVRLGNYMTGDGMKVKPEFYDLLYQIQDEYEYSVKYTVLPDNPNLEPLKEMMFNICKEAYFTKCPCF